MKFRWTEPTVVSWFRRWRSNMQAKKAPLRWGKSTAFWCNVTSCYMWGLSLNLWPKNGLFSWLIYWVWLSHKPICFKSAFIFLKATCFAQNVSWHILPDVIAASFPAGPGWRALASWVGTFTEWNIKMCSCSMLMMNLATTYLPAPKSCGNTEVLLNIHISGRT